MDIFKAILEIRPGARFAVNGNSYDGLEWYDDNELPPPSKEEVLESAQRLQAEYERNEYQRQRAQEYPSFAEQFDLLYHGGYDAWKAEIDKIKDKYPKPQ